MRRNKRRGVRRGASDVRREPSWSFLGPSFPYQFLSLFLSSSFSPVVSFPPHDRPLPSHRPPPTDRRDCLAAAGGREGGCIRPQRWQARGKGTWGGAGAGGETDPLFPEQLSTENLFESKPLQSTARSILGQVLLRQDESEEDEQARCAATRALPAPLPQARKQLLHCEIANSVRARVLARKKPQMYIWHVSVLVIQQGGPNH